MQAIKYNGQPVHARMTAGRLNPATLAGRLRRSCAGIACGMLAALSVQAATLDNSLPDDLTDMSMEALMDFETEACLACVSTKERQTSLKDFEDRKK